MAPRNALLLALVAAMLSDVNSFSSTLATFIRGQGSCKLGDVSSFRAETNLGSAGACGFKRTQHANSPSMQFGFPSLPSWATSSNVQYFAFGSNMNPAVLRGMRQVDPIDENPGFVKGYRLAFNMMGTPGERDTHDFAMVQSVLM